MSRIPASITFTADLTEADQQIEQFRREQELRKTRIGFEAGLSQGTFGGQGRDQFLLPPGSGGGGLGSAAGQLATAVGGITSSVTALGTVLGSFSGMIHSLMAGFGGFRGGGGPPGLPPGGGGGGQRALPPGQDFIDVEWFASTGASWRRAGLPPPGSWGGATTGGGGGLGGGGGPGVSPGAGGATGIGGGGAGGGAGGGGVGWGAMFSGFGGSGGAGGFFTRGSLGRVASFGFLLRESGRVLEDLAQFNQANILAQSDQGARVGAQLRLWEQLASVPIAGQFAQAIFDPFGEERGGIRLTLDQARQQDTLNYTRRSNRRFTETEIFRTQQLSSPITYQREIGQVNVAQRETELDLQQRRQEQLQQEAERFANQRAEVTRQYELTVPRAGHYLPNLLRYGSTGDVATRDAAMTAINQAQLQNEQQINARFEPAQQAAKDLANFQKDQIYRGRAVELLRPQYAAEVYGLRAQGRRDEADIREIEVQREIAHTQFEQDPIYLRSLDQEFEGQLGYARTRQRRERSVRETTIDTAAQASQQRAQFQPFEAGITEILGQNTLRTLQALPRDQTRVAMQNASALMEYVSDFARTVQRTNLANFGAAQVTNLLFSRDPRAAGVAEIQNRRDLELAQTPGGLTGLLIRGGIMARFGAQQRLYERNFDETRTAESEQRKVSARVAHRPSDPADG
jgi:hypothetical protein